MPGARTGRLLSFGSLKWHSSRRIYIHDPRPPMLTHLLKSSPTLQCLRFASSQSSHSSQHLVYPVPLFHPSDEMIWGLIWGMPWVGFWTTWGLPSMVRGYTHIVFDAFSHQSTQIYCQVTGQGCANLRVTERLLCLRFFTCPKLSGFSFALQSVTILGTNCCSWLPSPIPVSDFRPVVSPLTVTVIRRRTRLFLYSQLVPFLLIDCPYCFGYLSRRRQTPRPWYITYTGPDHATYIHSLLPSYF